MLRAAVDVDAELPDLRAIVTLRTDGPESWDAFLASGDGVDPAEIDARADAVTADDLSDILFTSGTTGNPKGVMETHGATLRAYQAWSDVVGLRAGDRYLIVNPFFHAFGYKAGWLAAMLTGATIHPQAVFDVDAVLERVGREQITMLPGPPTLFHTILDHPRRAGPRPLEPAPRGHRRRRHPGRADPAHARRAHLRDDHHRLRPHRVVRHRHDVPLRRRPRDHRHDERPRHPRRRGARGRRGGRRGAPRRARRGRGARLQRDARVPGRPVGDRGHRSTTTAGSTPATSA